MKQPLPPTPSKGMNTYTYKAKDGSAQSYNNSADYQNKVGPKAAGKEAAKELAKKKASKQTGSSGSPGGSYRTSPQNTRANNAQTDRDLKKSFNKYGTVGDIKTDRNGKVISALTGY